MPPLWCDLSGGRRSGSSAPEKAASTALALMAVEVAGCFTWESTPSQAFHSVVEWPSMVASDRVRFKGRATGSRYRISWHTETKATGVYYWRRQDQP
jgi:hypothetical protein